ncbi:hypothetical protein [sulfur-oxidizing endosymbiont of Gigantopelta aegis]|uniref:hypothetical protein n=1 Tax=sulfur-oxidizing endosymbiont of Gigantopelta aegis TaxID=2794934 RepID=UPI0018DC7AEC|nr:hypothetical protein [sulfur-oxidizing endosymbiont of Gigantopelta aegis]
MKRVMLVIELLMLCGPAVVMLSVGLLYSPVFLFGSVSIEGDWYIGALIIFCGTWGFISLGNLALHILSKRNWLGHPVQWFGILLGIAASGIGLSTMTNTNFMLWVFVAPIIAALHLLYLSKKCTQIS